MTPPEYPITVTNNTAAARYEVVIGDEVAILTYERRGDRIVLIHTEVPPALGGRGIAGALAKFALSEARANDWTVIPECEYVQAWLRRHPDQLDIVAEPWRSRLSQPDA